MDTFANRLAHAMESAEMRITDLSNATGVSKGRISHWLKGENIPGKNLLMVSRALPSATITQALGRMPGSSSS